MKNNNLFILIGLLLVLIGVLGCSQKTLPTAEVNFLSDKDGTVSVRAIGIGANEAEAIFDAEKNAFNVILFRGLPESKQKIALVGTNELEELKEHKKYFSSFFDEKRYRSFVMSSIPTSGLIKHKGGKKSIAVDIKINVYALRKDLEKNNVIRKFGF